MKLPEIRLRSTVVVPPIVLLVESKNVTMPVPWLDTAVVPVALVPMKLPEITLPCYRRRSATRFPYRRNRTDLRLKPLITRPRIVVPPPLTVSPLTSSLKDGMFAPLSTIFGCGVGAFGGRVDGSSGLAVALDNNRFGDRR